MGQSLWNTAIPTRAEHVPASDPLLLGGQNAFVFQETGTTYEKNIEVSFVLIFKSFLLCFQTIITSSPLPLPPSRPFHIPLLVLSSSIASFSLIAVHICVYACFQG